MTLSVLVVDDHPIVRGGIVSLLDAEAGYEAYGTSNDVPDS